MSRPVEQCLACSAAARDAMDLLEAGADADDRSMVRARDLVTGMDTERMWRCLLFLAAAGGALAVTTAGTTGLPVWEVLAVVREEMMGVDHGH